MPEIHGLCTTKPLKEGIEQLQKQYIITPLGMEETVELCNSFVLVPTSNGKVRLYLDPGRLNKAPIRPMHRGPTLNDFLPKLNNAQYPFLMDVTSGYHNLKLDEKSSYLTTFTRQLGRYRYKRLLYGAVPARDMFKQKLPKHFMIWPMYSALWMTF